jgi:hypothetical protein
VRTQPRADAAGTAASLTCPFLCADLTAAAGGSPTGKKGKKGKGGKGKK